MFSFLGNASAEQATHSEAGAAEQFDQSNIEADQAALQPSNGANAPGLGTPLPNTDVPPPPMPGTSVTRVKERCGGGVALALGGGAAKGWAHIGVIRAFEEAGIPISMIAGTSIGALVGGCYLAGKLDALEDFARSLTRAGMLRYMDFTLSGSGLISGSKLANNMNAHMEGFDIEALEKPFVAISTDIATGHEIWLHDGPLIEAIRASYALPGVFAPVVHQGRHLVDGAIVNPVPVSACRAYEPELVIAVDLNGETFGRGTVIRASHYAENDPGNSNGTAMAAALQAASADGAPSVRNVAPKSRLGMMGVMMEAFSIIQDRIARARLAGDPPDFTVRPRLANVGLADFHKAEEAIETGYQVTKSRLCELVETGDLAVVQA